MVKPTRDIPKEPEQEPVAEYIGENWDGSIVQLYEDLEKGTKLYITPPQRTWVSLDEEEMKKVWYAMKNIMGWYSFQEIAKAIEAKLKEKNT